MVVPDSSSIALVDPLSASSEMTESDTKHVDIIKESDVAQPGPLENIEPNSNLSENIEDNSESNVKELDSDQQVQVNESETNLVLDQGQEEPEVKDSESESEVNKDSEAITDSVTGSSIVTEDPEPELTPFVPEPIVDELNLDDLSKMSYTQLSTLLSDECTALQNADLSCSDAYKNERNLLRRFETITKTTEALISQKETLQHICKELQQQIRSISAQHEIIQKREEEKRIQIARTVTDHMKPIQEKETEEFEKEKKEATELREQLIKFTVEFTERNKIYKEQHEKREKQFNDFQSQIDDLRIKCEEKEEACKVLEGRITLLEAETGKKKRTVNAVLSKTLDLQKQMEEINAEFDMVSDNLLRWRKAADVWNLEYTKIARQTTLQREYMKMKKLLSRKLMKLRGGIKHAE